MSQTSRRNRRHFLQQSGASLTGLLTVPALGTSPLAAEALQGTATGRPEPDLIVVNATVYTMDAAQPQAEAFAVKDSRFVAVGASADIRNLAGRATQVFDGRGMTVTPGFIDCHNHAGGETLLYDVLVGNPFEVEFVTIRSIVAKLKERAQQTPPGTWVEGYFYDDTKVKDGRDVHLRDLDEVSRDHPVVVRHRGGHTAFYNSKAFEMAGITKQTPDPMGGTYDKDPNGELSGRVTDTAMAPLRVVGQRPQYTPAERATRARDGIAHISKQFARYGLTSVHHQGGDLAAIQDVRARGELVHRVSFETSGSMLESLITSGIRTGFGDEWIRFGSTSEHTVDGSFSERTMALSVPYPNRTPPYTGNVTDTQEALNEWVERVHRAGIQVNCHANGDVAIDMYLTAMERAQQRHPMADARPKITHCTLITDDLVRRIRALGAVPAMFTTYAYCNPDKFVYYGESMMQRSMAYRSMLDAGVYACAGSDFSPGPFAPLMGIQGMVTRKGWDGKVWGANQRVSVREAIAINSYNGAWASKEEAIKGSITAGKLADYVVLSGDPHTVDPDTLKDLRIVRTVVGGRISYQA